jgi:hypothetical protein
VNSLSWKALQSGWILTGIYVERKLLSACTND